MTIVSSHYNDPWIHVQTLRMVEFMVGDPKSGKDDYVANCLNLKNDYVSLNVLDLLFIESMIAF